MDDKAERKAPRRIFVIAAVAIFAAVYAGALWQHGTALSHQAVQDAEDKARAVTELLLDDPTLRASLARLLASTPAAEPDASEPLDRQVRDRVAHFGLRNAKIYRPDGTIVYAEDRDLIGIGFDSRPELRQAFDGQIASRVLSAAQYLRLYGVRSATSVVETYVPLGTTPDGTVPFVFESYQDFDPALARAQRRIAVGGVVLAGIMLLGLGALVAAYRRIHSLRAQVDTLERLLPICARCKKIRIQDAPAERWVPVEEYFQHRDHVQFTHGLCHDCVAVELAKVDRMRTTRNPGTGSSR